MPPSNRPRVTRVAILRWIPFLVIFLFVIYPLGACNRNNPAGSEFRVALLSPGPVNDNGWNAGAMDGLTAIGRELGAKTSQQEAHVASEIEDGFRRNAQKGAALIFGHGFEFGDGALKVAKEFPETVMIVSAGAPSVVAPNVASVVWRIEDTAYLCGRVAARVSKTGRAGCVGGVDIPPVRSSFLAFEEGAKSVNPAFEVRQSYIQSWVDIPSARSQTLSLIEAGCDIFFHNADAAGLGMLEAARSKGVRAFGCTRDQSDSAPETVLASATVDVPRSFVSIAKEVRDRTFKGRRIEFTRRDDVIGFVWNEKLKGALDPAIVKDIAETEQKLKSGSLTVRYHAP